MHLGYLAYDAEDSEVLIPNEEVRGEFLRAMDSGNWQEVIHAIQASEALLEAVWQQDGQAVAQGINAAHMETASILQYHNENALSCVVSLAFTVPEIIILLYESCLQVKVLQIWCLYRVSMLLINQP